MWVLAATTGMRRSELACAQVELLDLDAATLDLGDTRVVVAGKAIDEDGKSAAGRRAISLDTLTLAYLRRHAGGLAEERKAFGHKYEDHGLLFCHPDGKPLHPDTITGRFNRAIYTHPTAGQDRTAAEKVADVIFGDAWQPPEEHHARDDADTEDDL